MIINNYLFKKKLLLFIIYFLFLNLKIKYHNIKFNLNY